MHTYSRLCVFCVHLYQFNASFCVVYFPVVKRSFASSKTRLRGLATKHKLKHKVSMWEVKVFDIKWKHICSAVNCNENLYVCACCRKSQMLLNFRFNFNLSESCRAWIPRAERHDAVIFHRSKAASISVSLTHLSWDPDNRERKTLFNRNRVNERISFEM